MTQPTKDQPILVGITTYSGDFESRLILRKTLRHFRAINCRNLFLLVVSDGKLHDPQVRELADFVLDRPGPSGLHQGELDSIWQIIRFAEINGYTHVIKSAGDIIMAEPNWVQMVMKRFNDSGARILSTRWFCNDSSIVGTKFFVAEVDFLNKTMPKKIQLENLEEEFTAEIKKHYSIQKVAYLINSTTGEGHEVAHELKSWGWEHAHRLSKFVHLDDPSSIPERAFCQLILYPALRIKREIRRVINRMLQAK